jgi:hypothetical protein
MADDGGQGCGTALYNLWAGALVLFFAAVLGSVVLPLEEGTVRPWWHYLVGLPVGLVFLFLMNWLFDEGGWKWVLGPVAGLGASIWLFIAQSPMVVTLWGVGFLVVALVLGYFAQEKDSRPLAWNGAMLLLMALVLIVGGLIRGDWANPAGREQSQGGTEQAYHRDYSPPRNPLQMGLASSDLIFAFNTTR